MCVLLRELHKKNSFYCHRFEARLRNWTPREPIPHVFAAEEHQASQAVMSVVSGRLNLLDTRCEIQSLPVRKKVYLVDSSRDALSQYSTLCKPDEAS